MSANATADDVFKCNLPAQIVPTYDQKYLLLRVADAKKAKVSWIVIRRDAFALLLHAASLTAASVVLCTITATSWPTLKPRCIRHTRQLLCAFARDCACVATSDMPQNAGVEVESFSSRMALYWLGQCARALACCISHSLPPPSPLNNQTFGRSGGYGAVAKEHLPIVERCLRACAALQHLPITVTVTSYIRD